MLSKAELLYLQGHKAVSKSYERKIRCIIRKKMETLQKELPLLSKLFVNEFQTLLSIQPSHGSIPVKEENERLQRSSQQLTINDSNATESGNCKLNNIEQEGSKKLVDCESIEGSKTSNPGSNEATEFGNGSLKNATEFSNPVEKQRRERDLNPRGPHGPQAL